MPRPTPGLHGDMQPFGVPARINDTWTPESNNFWPTAVTLVPST